MNRISQWFARILVLAYLFLLGAGVGFLCIREWTRGQDLDQASMLFTEAKELLQQADDFKEIKELKVRLQNRTKRLEWLETLQKKGEEKRKGGKK